MGLPIEAARHVMGSTGPASSCADRTSRHAIRDESPRATGAVIRHAYGEPNGVRTAPHGPRLGRRGVGCANACAARNGCTTQPNRPHCTGLGCDLPGTAMVP